MNVPRAGEQKVLEIEATWEAKLAAVAVFQQKTGIMTERC